MPLYQPCFRSDVYLVCLLRCLGLGFLEGVAKSFLSLLLTPWDITHSLALLAG